MNYDYLPPNHPSTTTFRRDVVDLQNTCCGGRAWFIRDVCGIICASMTWFLILYAEFVVMTIILLPNPSFYSYANMVIFNLLAFLASSSHMRAMLSDPVKSLLICIYQRKILILTSIFQGAVPKGNATNKAIQEMGLREGQVLFKCPKCCSIKPERAHHCSVCQRCIRKMDHHCVWVNNCVGEGNQKYFVLFTVCI